ncbi:unnamed protein product [Medioppia subpectinata]|uniref:Uncharacterized protein n=1 Tax=Medioppia subpectinata TaxID=1979941 RepID=A0A7R9KIP1_9ACAR|nr:unnamed protein product [Medioppia subpectinata]CAG2104192.1 unnamed protein product [Medioppia subpectinata]
MKSILYLAVILAISLSAINCQKLDNTDTTEATTGESVDTDLGASDVKTPVDSGTGDSSATGAGLSPLKTFMTSMQLEGVRLYDRLNERAQEVGHRLQENLQQGQKKFQGGFNRLRERGQQFVQGVQSDAGQADGETSVGDAPTNPLSRLRQFFGQEVEEDPEETETLTPTETEEVASDQESAASDDSPTDDSGWSEMSDNTDESTDSSTPTSILTNLMTRLTLKGVRLYDRLNEKVESARQRWRAHQNRLMNRVNQLQDTAENGVSSMVKRLDRFNLFGGI